MPPYDPRQDITDTLLQQQGASPLAYGMAGLGSAAPAMASPMTGPTLPGLPATPAGGVPGAGIGPAGPSSLALPPQRGGVQGALPSMGSLGAGMGAVGGMPRGGPVPPVPQLGAQGGMGQMSDFENPSLGRMRPRRAY